MKRRLAAGSLALVFMFVLGLIMDIQGLQSTAYGVITAFAIGGAVMASDRIAARRNQINE